MNKLNELTGKCLECIDAWKKENWHQPLDIEPGNYMSYCYQHGGIELKELYDEVFSDEERQQRDLERLEHLLHIRNNESNT